MGEIRSTDGPLRISGSPETSTSASGQTGPRATFFPTPGTEPGVNTDVLIRVSLNGKLISVCHQNSMGETVDGNELYGVNWTEFDNLVGRLLTLCDATFTDPVQRKAFKDMVRQHVKEWVNAIAVDAAADAGIERHLTAPFVGGVLDQVGGLFGVEGEPTP